MADNSSILRLQGLIAEAGRLMETDGGGGKCFSVLSVVMATMEGIEAGSTGDKSSSSSASSSASKSDKAVAGSDAFTAAGGCFSIMSVVLPE